MNIASIVDISALSRWLETKVPGFAPPIASVVPFTGGRSNITLRVSDDAGSFTVVRRPPLGTISKSAHDVHREARILRSLSAQDVPVPTVYGESSETAILGAPFYAMEFVDGIVLDGLDDPTITPTERIRIGESLVDVLCRLHTVDPDDSVFGTAARRSDYVGRQLSRWLGQWQGPDGTVHDEFLECHRRLHLRAPTDHPLRIVHGDYRLGNVVLADGRVTAVLDWELTTTGHPLADVGYLVNSWTDVRGGPTRDELRDRYCAATGSHVDDIAYFRAFSYWRLASIRSGVLRRYESGGLPTPENVDLGVLAASIGDLVEQSLALLRS